MAVSSLVGGLCLSRRWFCMLNRGEIGSCVAGVALFGMGLLLCNASAQSPRPPVSVPRSQVQRQASPRSEPTATLLVTGCPETASIAILDATNPQGNVRAGRVGGPIYNLPASRALRVRVYDSGYDPVTFVAFLKPGTLLATNITLRPLPATLTVDVIPRSAEVVVAWEGESRTNRSGEAITGLPLNRSIEVTAMAPGCLSLTTNVQFSRGGEVLLDLGRLPRCDPPVTRSWLQVECNPPDASITYQIQDGPKTPLKAPSRVETIPLGKLVSVVGTKEGFDMDYRTVTLTNPAGQTVTLHLKLSQASILVKGTPVGADVEVTLDPSHIAKGKINRPIEADWLKALNKVVVKVSSANHIPQESSLTLQAGTNGLRMNLAKIPAPPVAVTAPANGSPLGGTDSPPAALGGTSQAIPLSGPNSLESKAMAEAFAIQVQFETDYKKKGAPFIPPPILQAWKAQLDKIGSDYTKATGIPMDKRKEPWVSIEKVRQRITAYAE